MFHKSVFVNLVEYISYFNDNASTECLISITCGPPSVGEESFNSLTMSSFICPRQKHETPQRQDEENKMLKLVTQLALIMIIGHLDANPEPRLRVETRKTVFLVRLLTVLIVRDSSIFMNNKEP